MPDAARKHSRPVKAGVITIGGGAPVSVQSMCTTATRDVETTLAQIWELSCAGCELVRLAVPDQESISALKDIVAKSPLPVVADIHFDCRLAIAAIRAGVHKIRINPGNMKDPQGLRQIAREAKERGIPIRVGVNAGSLDRKQMDLSGGVTAEMLARYALDACRQLEALDFYDIVLSAKASSPLLMIETYRLLSKKSPYPLHLGVTEAGTPAQGVIRSAVGIGTLLAEGIGDTIRVSLTADPVEEVHAAYSILATLSLRQRGAVLISCPTCGRTEVPLMEIAEKVERRLRSIDLPLRVAVMGCVVNGPGEAREADVGIAGGRDSFVLFRKGEIVRKVGAEQAFEVLMAEIDRLLEENKSGD
ncbi:MAG: flavodoxin-dependent (E)-4-hydroxy-3-methylbut-2-enyl-diphosphate synthase [Clostridiaceae bacterium]|nr:flavodoxin-dependent (E)-4-hydroxy-3-methylbut-2-enyl-diphosphate synthase [Clostridiaceae bacterium]